MTGKTCDECHRFLVTQDALARAAHSGCALTGEKHDLTECPSEATFRLDAKAMWKYMERKAQQGEQQGS